MLIDLSMS